MTHVIPLRRPSLSPITDELLSQIGMEFRKRAAHYDQHGEFPHENFQRLSELGLLGLIVPMELGGAGGNLHEATRVVGAIAGGDGSTALVLTMHYLMHAITRNTNPPIYAKMAAAAVKGGGILNALRAEPDLGSINRGGTVATLATQLPDGRWRITGRKAYATGSAITGWWLVYARVDGADDKVGSWLVPARAPGIVYPETWNHTGMRATASHEAHFNGVEIDADHLLNVIDAKSAAAPPPILNAWNGALLAALYDGIARAARDWVRDFLLNRKPSNLGASLATVPRLQSVLGEIESLLLINRSLISEITRDVDANGADASPRPNLVKQIVTENTIRVTDLALSISGNHGLDRANPLERYHRDALCGRVHAPQGDSIFVSAGKASLDVSAP